MRLVDLPTWDGRDVLRVVVETPRGSTAKIKYDAELGLFVHQRPLPRGIRYPYDWGFFPGTTGPDGDPVDAMVLHEAASFPGVVIRCKALAALKVTQNRKRGGGRERNDRIVVVPVDEPESRVPELDRRLRRELEHFFLGSVLLQDKDVRIVGWGRDWEAKAIVRAGQRAYEGSDGAT